MECGDAGFGTNYSRARLPSLGRRGQPRRRCRRSLARSPAGDLEDVARRDWPRLCQRAVGEISQAAEGKGVSKEAARGVATPVPLQGCGSSSGKINSGPVLRTLPTLLSTRQIFSRSSGQGRSSASNSCSVAGSSPSHFGQSLLARMTGMRLWISAIASFGAQVSTVQLWISLSLAGLRHVLPTLIPKPWRLADTCPPGAALWSSLNRVRRWLRLKKIQQSVEFNDLLRGQNSGD
jgi:hypothetical protein